MPNDEAARQLGPSYFSFATSLATWWGIRWKSASIARGRHSRRNRHRRPCLATINRARLYRFYNVGTAKFQRPHGEFRSTSRLEGQHINTYVTSLRVKDDTNYVSFLSSAKAAVQMPQLLVLCSLWPALSGHHSLSVLNGTYYAATMCTAMCI